MTAGLFDRVDTIFFSLCGISNFLLITNRCGVEIEKVRCVDSLYIYIIKYIYIYILICICIYI